MERENCWLQPLLDFENGGEGGGKVERKCGKGGGYEGSSGSRQQQGGWRRTIVGENGTSMVI